MIGSYIIYKVTDAIIPLRVTHDQEELGLDLSQHGESFDAVGEQYSASGSVKELPLRRVDRKAEAA